MRRHHTIIAALFVAMTIVPAVLPAQVTQYTSLSAWLAAVANPGLDDFDDLSPGFRDSPVARSAGAYLYEASAPSGLFVVAPNGDPALSVNAPEDAITLSGFSSTVRALGGFFFGTDFDGNSVTSAIAVSWVTGSGSGSAQLATATPSNFFGIVAAAPISSFTITAPQSVEAVYATVDDLRLATVPEPQTYVLTGVGLLALGALSRRRQRLAAR